MQKKLKTLLVLALIFALSLPLIPKASHAKKLQILYVNDMYSHNMDEPIYILAELPSRYSRPKLFLDDTELELTLAPSKIYGNNCYSIVGSLTEDILPQKGKHSLKLKVDDMVSTSYIYFDNYNIYDESSASNGESELFVYYPFNEKNDVYYVNGDSSKNTIEISDVGTDTPNKALHLSRTVSKECRCEIVMPSKLWNVNNFVIEFDIMTVSSKVPISLIELVDDSANMTSSFSIDNGDLYINGLAITEILDGVWYNIAVALDYTNNTYSLYINDMVYVTDKKFGKTFVAPHTYRTRIVSDSYGNHSAEYYFDELKIYSGDKKQEFSSSELVRASTLEPIGESDEYARGLIGNASVFTLNADSAYIDGEKLSYSANGYAPYLSEGGDFMLPQKLIETAFKMPVSIEGISAAYENKDGVYYISLNDMVSATTGMYLYDDGRGMYMLDNNPIKYSNSAVVYELGEDIDVIYRYMFFKRASGEEIISDFNKKAIPHPRLIATASDIAESKALIESSDDFKGYLENTESLAAKTMSSLLTQNRVEGSFLDSARNLVSRIRRYGTLYRLTANTDYSDRAWEEMENAILNWSNWNERTTNFLDTSETAYGIALGYDLIYDELDAVKKELIIDALFERFLDPVSNAYSGRHSRLHWVTGELTNWSFVCNGAAVSTCLAIADEPSVSGERLEKLKFILENAKRSVEFSLMALYPDGAWPEGPGYWQYSMMYLYGGILAPLKNCLGTTYGINDMPGVRDTLRCILSQQGPSGNGFNYGDTYHNFVEKDGIGYLIAKINEDADAMNKWHTAVLANSNKIGETVGDEKTLLWYRPIQVAESTIMTDNYFRGNDVGVMRASYEDTDAAFVAVKGGYVGSSETHANLDRGNFIFDSQGVRWADELGFDDYNAIGSAYWMRHFEIYRARPEGQNVLVINPRADDYAANPRYYGGQLLNTNAPLEKSRLNEANPYIVYDLSEVYSVDAKKYKRGFMLTDNRQSLVIRDELDLNYNENVEILWFMHTKTTDIEIVDGGKAAIITRQGKQLKVEAVCTVDDWAFEVREVKPLETSPVIEGQLQGDDYGVSGFRKLTLKANAKGSLKITVKLTPLAQSDVFSSVETIGDIASW